jgi:hypothetical protein
MASLLGGQREREACATLRENMPWRYVPSRAELLAPASAPTALVLTMTPVAQEAHRALPASITRL